MKPKIAMCVVASVLSIGSWAGCADERPAEPEPAPAPPPAPPTPMAPPPTQAEADTTPSEQALPVADDFEAEATSEITTDNYVAELEKLEGEISADEGAAPAE